MRADLKVRENGHLVHIYQVTKEKEGEEVVVDYIHADKPGSRSNYNGPMKVGHKERFPRAVEAWERNENVEIVGTPIDRLPGIPENIVAEYTSKELLTIEDLASLDDSDLSRFSLGRKYHEEAKRYLDFSDPEVRKREQEEMKEAMKAELLSEIMGSPDAIKTIADEMGLAVSKKRQKKTEE